MDSKKMVKISPICSLITILTNKIPTGLTQVPVTKLDPFKSMRLIARQHLKNSKHYL